MASSPLRAALVAALFAAALAQAAEPGARVQVLFAAPQKFTDVKSDYMGGDRERDALLDQLRQHLEQRAAPHVPEDHRLTVTITDVDMAGGFEPWRAPALGSVRIVKDVYPLRIRLEFKVTDAGGAAVSAGKRELTDLAFMSSPDILRNDLLKREKALLDGWLAREFPGAK